MVGHAVDWKQIVRVIMGQQRSLDFSGSATKVSQKREAQFDLEVRKALSHRREPVGKAILTTD